MRSFVQRRGVFLAVALLLGLGVQVAAADPVGVRLDLNGLEDLGDGWAYEGWLIVDGSPISTGVFTIDAGGVPSADRFTADVAPGAAIGAFVLTIEPVPDPDPAPSAVHVLGGSFAGARAPLSVGHPAALGNDFGMASGAYILAAPSAGEGGDYRNGIWWLDPVDPPLPTLVLPPLPGGWKYEGWVVGPDGPVSTGKFRLTNAADSDGGGAAAGELPTPPFPGQDFVDPARDLTSGYAAVISIEPYPDNSPAPFALKPLVDGTVDDVGAKVLQFMTNNAASLPTGRAVLLEPVYFPIAAHVAGLGGTMWRTDATVASDLDTSTTYDVEFLRAGGGAATHRYTLGPEQSADYPDVVGSTLGMDGIGALRFWLEWSPRVGATTRTYNQTSSGPLGSVIRPLRMAEAVRYGGKAYLLQLARSGSMTDGYRTNVGVLNVAMAPIDVVIDLYGGGAHLGSVTMTLEPGELRQVTEIFGKVTPGGVPSGYAVVSTTTEGGAFFTYASVVHNGSGAFFYHTP